MRSRMRLGDFLVAYGAGGHNVVNPVAGPYAEQDDASPISRRYIRASARKAKTRR